jgi:small subunit ribosomal protein S8
MAARHPKVDVPASKLKNEIARILKEEGYIATSRWPKKAPRKHPHLSEVHAGQRAGDLADRARFAARVPRVCRQPGIPRVLGGLGINILTTPRGVMTGSGRRARKASAAKFCASLVRS